MCRLNRLGRSGVTQNSFFFKLSFKTYKKVSTRISEQQKGFSSPVPLLCPINRCTLGNYLSTSKHLFCNFSSDLLTIINFLAFPVWHHMSRRDRRCRRPHSSVYQSVTVSHKPLGGVKGRTAMFPDTDKWTSVAPAKTTTGRELTSAATRYVSLLEKCCLSVLLTKSHMTTPLHWMKAHSYHGEDEKVIPFHVVQWLIISYLWPLTSLTDISSS